jgi:hypothetical protein
MNICLTSIVRNSCDWHHHPLRLAKPPLFSFRIPAFQSPRNIVMISRVLRSFAISGASQSPPVYRLAVTRSLPPVKGGTGPTVAPVTVSKAARSSRLSRWRLKSYQHPISPGTSTPQSHSSPSVCCAQAPTCLCPCDCNPTVYAAYATL